MENRMKSISVWLKSKLADTVLIISVPTTYLELSNDIWGF